MQQTGVCDLPEVGGNTSAGLLAERIAVLPYSDKMGGKDYCLVTTAPIKARNSAEHLFILQRISVTNIILSKPKS